MAIPWASVRRARSGKWRCCRCKGAILSVPVEPSPAVWSLIEAKRPRLIFLSPHKTHSINPQFFALTLHRPTPMLYVSVLIELLRSRPAAAVGLAALPNVVLWPFSPSLFYAGPPGALPMVLAI